MKPSSLRLCLVTNINQSFDLYQQFLLQAIAGGVTAIQLRAKNMAFETMLQWANDLKVLLTPHHIPLIINDNLEIAIAVDAAGVHLGQQDIAPAEARAILGADKMIGLSVETEADLANANQLTCIDYIAASAVFPTQSKHNCKHYWGLTGLKSMVQRSQYPVIAIGGIGLNQVADIMRCKVAGIAVISAIHDHPEPTKATRALIQAMNNEDSCHVN